VPIPLLAHFDLDRECSGYIDEVMEEEGPKFICNECEAVISKEDVARLVRQIESTRVACTHCGQVNDISGFSEVSAFVCRFCGEGVGLK